MIFLVQFGINKPELIFQRLTKLHEPVGRVQFGVFDLQVLIYSKSHEKNHVIHEKMQDGWAEETHAYHVMREKLRHSGRVLDLKADDLIGPNQTVLFSSQSLFFHCGCVELTLFCTVYKKTALSQTESSNFFMHISYRWLCLVNVHIDNVRNVTTASSLSADWLLISVFSLVGTAFFLSMSLFFLRRLITQSDKTQCDQMMSLVTKTKDYQQLFHLASAL